jgi:hypothetical protein
MNYWLDLFTGTTWTEFQAAGSRISGFRQSMRGSLHRVKPGDKTNDAGSSAFQQSCPCRSQKKTNQYLVSLERSRRDTPRYSGSF